MTKPMTYVEVRDTVASWSIEGKRLPIVEFIDTQQRAIEQAQRLIKTARMCMNPKNNANWFDEATAFLAGSAVEPEPLQRQPRQTRYCDYDLCADTFDPAHSNANHIACECLIIDKEPSAYHNEKCPRFVADKL